MNIENRYSITFSPLGTDEHGEAAQEYTLLLGKRRELSNKGLPTDHLEEEIEKARREVHSHWKPEAPHHPHRASNY